VELTVPRLGDDEIALRPPVPGDVDAITEACQDPEIPRWTRVPSPYTRAHAVEFVERSARTWKQGTDAPFVIVDAETGRLLGAIGVHRFARTTAPRSATDSSGKRAAAVSPRGRSGWWPAGPATSSASGCCSKPTPATRRRAPDYRSPLGC